MNVVDPTKIRLADADCNCLTPTPLEYGWGRLYQSSYANNWVWELPKPVVIVQMNGDTNDLRLLDRSVVVGILNFSIPDTPDSCLPDAVYLGLVASVVGLLASGVNVLSHCAAGVSRSGYVSLGAIMAARRWDYGAALFFAKQFRPVVGPNHGFEAQLRRLERRLHLIGEPYVDQN